ELSALGFPFLDKYDVVSPEDPSKYRWIASYNHHGTPASVTLLHGVGRLSPAAWGGSGNRKELLRAIDVRLVAVRQDLTMACSRTSTRECFGATALCRSFWCSSLEVRYIGTSISDGPGCLMLRCPDLTCGAAVGQDMINALVSGEDKVKYSRYLLRSYIEDNRKKLKTHVIRKPWMA
ncbi:hypothetical protein Taro_055311, partial [Colocasia esculenta]|nr:hypothetical protein [Colocasia esculenta]